MEKPIIICIVGESGSGKTLMTEWIEYKYSIPMIESYTTRPKRNPEEKGHTFISEGEFDKLKEEDMIAFTSWQNKRYCCLKQDVNKPIMTYILDQHGYLYLKEHFKFDYKIVAVRVYRNEKERIESVGEERVGRDEGKFNLWDDSYDYILYNNSTGDFFIEINKVIDKILGRYQFKIYVAGALNSNACGYISNLHLMSKYAEKVRKEGFAVYNPGCDFIQGVINGDLTYEDYVNNTLPFMYCCDALALVPNDKNKDSEGTQREIKEAKERGIHVLETFDDVLKYKKIMKVM
jgi:guanylate kinase